MQPLEPPPVDKEIAAFADHAFTVVPLAEARGGLLTAPRAPSHALPRCARRNGRCNGRATAAALSRRRDTLLSGRQCASE